MTLVQIQHATEGNNNNNRERHILAGLAERTQHSADADRERCDDGRQALPASHVRAVAVRLGVAHNRLTTIAVGRPTPESEIVVSDHRFTATLP